MAELQNLKLSRVFCDWFPGKAVEHRYDQFDIYHPRNPKASSYYKCVENNFEDLELAWDDMYAFRYGFWRTYVMTVIYKYWVFSIPKRLRIYFHTT